MKNIIIGADHAGFALKEYLKVQFKNQVNFFDVGTHDEQSMDYPDIVHPLCEQLPQYEAGILICGSGNGVCLTANKHKGVRAALAWLPEIATLAKQHNNANVLCLPARFVSEEQALEIVQSYLSATFEGGRHEKRVCKIDL